MTGGGESAHGRGDVKDVNPETLLTRGQVAELRSIGRALKAAADRLQRGDIDPSLLDKLGMTREGFKGFVEKYSRRFERIRKDYAANNTGRIAPGAVTMVGDAKLSTGGDGYGPATDDTREGGKTDTEIRIERGRTVSPAFRKSLEAFLRAVGRERSGN